jgi:hypothetical protein
MTLRHSYTWWTKVEPPSASKAYQDTTTDLELALLEIESLREKLKDSKAHAKALEKALEEKYRPGTEIDIRPRQERLPEFPKERP